MIRDEDGEQLVMLVQPLVRQEVVDAIQPAVARIVSDLQDKFGATTETQRLEGFALGHLLYLLVKSGADMVVDGDRYQIGPLP